MIAFRKKRRLFRFLCALACSLLVLFLFATSCLLFYQDSINSYFRIETGKVVDDPNADTDTEYYKSDYGALTAANFYRLQADAYAHVVKEAEEGAVLLQNNGALPLTSERTVSLFGHASVDPLYKTRAAGTAEYKNPDNTVDYKEALESVGLSVNPTLWNAYRAGKAARTSGSATSGEESVSFYTDSVTASFADYADVAIVVLAREGGEGVDMATAELDSDGNAISSLALHQNERDMLSLIQQSHFKKTIVLLNTPYQLELGWLEEYGVDACLWISCPGLTGLTGIANLLTGKANPSGKSVDTWAVNSLGSPAVQNANGNTSVWTNADTYHNDGIVTDHESNTDYVSIQLESIYVGYRYYETRYAESVLGNTTADSAVGAKPGATAWRYADELCFPFGHGLSYTTFRQTLQSVQKTDQTYTLTVAVENVGEVAGKSVVQIYAQTPYGDYEKANLVEKSAVQLVGFGKTKELAPHETELVTVEVEEYLLASYDAKQTKGYLLSAGDYYFAIGDNAHDALNQILAAQNKTNLIDFDGAPFTPTKDKTYTWTQNSIDRTSYATGENNVRVTNRFDNADANYWNNNSLTYLTRQDWSTFPKTTSIACTGVEMQTLLEGKLYEKSADAPSAENFSQGVEHNIPFVTMRNVAYTDVLWDTFLDQFTLDELGKITANFLGSPAIDSVSLPKKDGGDGCDSIGSNSFPTAYSDGRGACLYTTLIASTWNEDLIRERGILMANESLFMGYAEVWTGGGNLHRTPFGGRQSEYYSEDANLCYLISAIELPEFDKRGVNGGIKHFAGNDQESHREGLSVFFTEQGFREGALRSFEGALRKGGCRSSMQAYNRLGVVWCSASSALNNTVLREEWGFVGHLITDATMSSRVGYKAHYTTTISNGTDLYCYDNGTAGKTIVKAIRETDDGTLLASLRLAAKNTVYALSRTCAVNGLSSTGRIVSVTPVWKICVYAVDGLTALLALGSTVCYVLALVQKEKKP